MDKVKLVLDFCKKYLFWFIAATTVVVVVVCWWMSTNSLATQFQTDKKAIDAKNGSIEAIVGEAQTHPTPQFKTAVEEKHKKLKEGVLKVWTTLYDDQKKNNPWPAELGKKFIDTVKTLGPEEDIPYDLRNIYLNVINKYFDALYNIIDLRRPVETTTNEPAKAPPVLGNTRISRSMAAFIGRGAQTNVEMKGVVDWDEKDQERLKEQFDWKTIPSSLQIRLAQEDLWIYKTLLTVISETNKDDKNNPITEHNQAPVKKIEWLLIGSEAGKTWTDADGMVFRIHTKDPSEDRRGGAPAASGRETVAADSKEALLKDRYVDDKGVPLDSEAKQPYAEFKMMPISMKIIMDQRKINKLLTECVNRAMPIEVRRVRICPGDSLEPPLEGSATGEAAGPSVVRQDTGRRDVGRRDVGRGYGGRGTEMAAESELSPYDIPVEIHGIIYIYNPPDLATLGTGTASDKTATEKTTEGAPGAAPAATPTATPDAATPPAAEGATTTPPATPPEPIPAKTEDTPPVVPKTEN